MMRPFVMLCGCAGPVVEGCAGSYSGSPTCGGDGLLTCSPGAIPSIKYSSLTVDVQPCNPYNEMKNAKWKLNSNQMSTSIQ